MKSIPVFVGLSAILGLGVAFAASQTERPDRPVTEGLGVCEGTVTSVSCWDMKGTRDSKLTDRVKELWEASSDNISFKFGSRNLFLVMTLPTQGDFNVERDTGYISSFNVGSGRNGLKFVRVSGEDEIDPAISIRVVSYGASSVGPNVTLSATPGSTANLDGHEIRMGFSKLQNFTKDSPQWGPPHYDKQWLIVMGMAGGVSGSLGVDALDKSGKPISYVDRSGKPITPVQYLGSTAPNRPGEPQPQPGPDAKFVPFYIRNRGTQVPDAFVAETDVDPQYLGSLKISIQHAAYQKVGPFPLSPNP